MAEERPQALTSWRRIADVDGLELSIRYDCGDWVLQSRRTDGRGEIVKDLDVSPAAMDALIASWPRIRSLMP